MEEWLAAQDRYLSAKQRLQLVVDAMHPGMAKACDLDGLDRLTAALDRVALKGDRIEVRTAHSMAHEAKVAEGGLARALAGASGEYAQAVLLNPEGVEDPAEVGATEGSGQGAAQEPDDGAEGQGELPPDAAASPTIDPATALVETLVVKQKPPIAKAGRGRGFRLKEGGE